MRAVTSPFYTVNASRSLPACERNASLPGSGLRPGPAWPHGPKRGSPGSDRVTSHETCSAGARVRRPRAGAGIRDDLVWTLRRIRAVLRALEGVASECRSRRSKPRSRLRWRRVLSLTPDALERAPFELDAALRRAAGTDTFCSSTAWPLSAHEALMPAREPFCFRGEHGWVLLARRWHDAGWSSLEPLEAAWFLGSSLPCATRGSSRPRDDGSERRRDVPRANRRPNGRSPEPAEWAGGGRKVA
jgi:hypothetical protein